LSSKFVPCTPQEGLELGLGRSALKLKDIQEGEAVVISLFERSASREFGLISFEWTVCYIPYAQYFYKCNAKSVLVDACLNNDIDNRMLMRKNPCRTILE